MENGYRCSRTGKRSWKYSLRPEDGHVPSKTESKIIRKLMIKSGMTKEEVLAIKENRVLIAEKLKSTKKSHVSFFKKDINNKWKNARKITGLPDGHPMTKLIFNGILRHSDYHNCPVVISEKDMKWLTDNKVEYREGVVKGRQYLYLKQYYGTTRN